MGRRTAQREHPFSEMEELGPGGVSLLRALHIDVDLSKGAYQG